MRRPDEDRRPMDAGIVPEPTSPTATFGEYLRTIGLGRLSNRAEEVRYSIVAEALATRVPPQLSADEVRKLYEYEVPELSPDGSCSLGGVAEEPYDLAQVLGGQSEAQTQRLWSLRQITRGLTALTGADWLGIYRSTTNAAGESVLVKESYVGRRSRPEFPLTEEFAKGSNNSTVGLSGKAVVVEDVFAYAGPYYVCDGEVQSEFCLPILDAQGGVMGIIDAESFEKRHFTDERLLQIARVAYDLGKFNLGQDTALNQPAPQVPTA